MRKLFTILMTTSALTALFVAPGCNDEGEIDICDDDLDCNDGFICEITGEDDGVCVEDLGED